MSDQSSALVRLHGQTVMQAGEGGHPGDSGTHPAHDDRQFVDQLTQAVYSLPSRNRLPTINGFVKNLRDQAAQGDPALNRRGLAATASVFATFAMIEPCSERIVGDVLDLSQAAKANHMMGDQLQALRSRVVEAGGYSRDEPLVAMVETLPIGDRDLRNLEQYDSVTPGAFNRRDAENAAALFDAVQTGDVRRIEVVRREITGEDDLLPAIRSPVETSVVVEQKSGLSAFLNRLRHHKTARSSQVSG